MPADGAGGGKENRRAGVARAVESAEVPVPITLSSTLAADRNEALGQMLEMGHNFDSSLVALEQSNWDVVRATEMLLAEGLHAESIDASVV